MNDHKLKKLSKLFDINSLKPDHINYFVLNPDKNICNDIENPLFDNIEPDDFHKPIKNLYKQYKLPHFARLLSYQIDTLKVYHDKIKKIRYYDEIMLHYVKCRPQSSIITCWDNMNDEDIKTIVKFLRKNGKVYYIRRFRFTNKQLENLIYHR